MSIMVETRKMIDAARTVGRDVDKLTLPLSRLNEFLLDAVSDRRMTIAEIEQMRQSCLRGEAKVWGVPVEFKDESAS